MHVTQNPPHNAGRKRIDIIKCAQKKIAKKTFCEKVGPVFTFRLIFASFICTVVALVLLQCDCRSSSISSSVIGAGKNGLSEFDTRQFPPESRSIADQILVKLDLLADTALSADVGELELVISNTFVWWQERRKGCPQIWSSRSGIFELATRKMSPDRRKCSRPRHNSEVYGSLETPISIQFHFMTKK